MGDKFENIPTDEGVQVLSELVCKLGETDLCYQRWVWEGVSSESFIFAEEDLAAMADEDVEKLVRTSPLVKPASCVLIRRTGSGYIFASFNAISSEDL